MRSPDDELAASGSPTRPESTPEQHAAGAPSGVCVLGMHRSGTSAATRLVNLLGLSTCVEADLLNDTGGNARGHWESVSLVAMNDRLLTEMGRAWWCPPRSGEDYRVDAEMVTTDPALARAAFEAVHPDRPWVWKDPRTCLLLPFWRHALQEPVAAIVTIRNPLDVATSLLERDGLAIPLGVALWERYNRLVLSSLAGLPVHVTRYDDLVADPVRWSGVVKEFLDGVGVGPIDPVDAEAVKEFVDPGLRHARHSLVEVVDEFVSAAAVLDALDASAGSWDAFEAPDLPPEPAWVEAEFVAIGAWQTTPLPVPAPTTLSVIVGALGRPPDEVVNWLSGQLLPYAEGIVVTDAAEPPAGHAGTAAPPASGRRPVRVVRVPPGTPLGAAREAGAKVAVAQQLEFRAPGTTTSNRWAPEMRRAFAAGYSAVTPEVVSRSGGGFGQTITSRTLDRRWSQRPVDDIATTPVMAAACLAMPAEALRAAGGFETSLGAYGLDVHELSVRIWRIGRRCAVAAGARADTLDEFVGISDPAAVDWEAFVHDFVHLGAVHLDEDELASLVGALSGRPGAPRAIARVLTSEAAARRGELSRSGAAGTDTLLRYCGVAEATKRHHPPDTFVVSGASGGSRAPVSVVVTGSGGVAALASAASGLAPELPEGAEVIVSGSRAAGGARARGDVLVFLDLDAVAGRSGEWVRPLAAEAARPHAGAVGPAILPYGRSARPVCGLTFADEMLGLRWLPAGRATHDVPVVPGACVAIRRAVYESFGGYDADLEGTGWADAELCLRLARSGHPARVVPESQVILARTWWSGPDGRWEGMLFGLLRLAALHLDEEDHTALLARACSRRDFGGAVARVAVGDAGAKRHEIARHANETAGDVLRRLSPPDL